MYTYDMRRNKHNIKTYYRTRLFWSKNNNDKENKYKIFTISIRLWISQDVGHINMFVSPCKQRLNDCLTQNWSDNLSSSSRCDTYCTFKSLLNIEKYLSIDIHFYFRKSFARFRCSSHKLNIEL